MNLKPDINVTELIQNGFEEKFARYYLDGIELEQKNPLYDETYGAWAHSKGFPVNHAFAYGLNEQNLVNYCSKYDYDRLWPANSWSKIWIDDKLTLKYMLYGTKFSNLMPEYYFYSTKAGLRGLMDNPYPDNQDIGTLLQVIKDKGAIACKENNGSFGVGFFKLSYENNRFFMNEEVVDEQKIQEIVEGNPNYIFTEYLYPCEQLAKIHHMIQTIRVVVLNVHGNDPFIVSKHIRFGMDALGATNFKGENTAENFNLFAYVDLDNGHIGDAFNLYFNRIEQCSIHPDTKEKIDVTLPELRKVKEAALEIAKYFSNLEWLGYDFCITPNGIKIMEINSHPDLKMIQVMQPLYKVPEIKEWITKKMRRKI